MSGALSVAKYSMSPLRIIIPMKPLNQAKSRLWSAVPALERGSVTLLMLDTVVRAAVMAQGPSAVHVIGGDALIREVVHDAGATWKEDPGGGLNLSVVSAMRSAYIDGCTAALFIPGDLPMLQTDDVVAITVASRNNTVPVGVRAEPDGGTNALLIPAACTFNTLLGEDSFAKHVAAAGDAGVRLAAINLPRVAFDMDSFEDMVWARESITGFSAQLHDWENRLRRNPDNLKYLAQERT